MNQEQAHKLAKHFDAIAKEFAALSTILAPDSDKVATQSNKQPKPSTVSIELNKTEEISLYDIRKVLVEKSKELGESSIRQLLGSLNDGNEFFQDFPKERYYELKEALDKL